MNGHEWTMTDTDEKGDTVRTVCWSRGGDNYGAYEQDVYEDGKGGPRRCVDDSDALECFASELLRLAEENERLRGGIATLWDYLARNFSAVEEAAHQAPAVHQIVREIQATRHDASLQDKPPAQE